MTKCICAGHRTRRVEGATFQARLAQVRNQDSDPFKLTTRCRHFQVTHDPLSSTIVAHLRWFLVRETKIIRRISSNMRFNIDDLPVNAFTTTCIVLVAEDDSSPDSFPLRQDISWYVHYLLCCLLELHLTRVEQYAYMCDLKRTLDATVSSIIIPLPEHRVITQNLGPLRFGDAFWNWEDCFSVIPDCLLPTSMNAWSLRQKLN